MKRSLLFASFAALAWPGSPEPDLRLVAWGMSQAEVRATESAQPNEIRAREDEVIVTYDSVMLGGLPSRLVYFFAQDKLVRAKYLFETGHSDPDEFIADFRSVEPVLREKHGKPAVERTVWEDDDLQTERAAYLEQDRATPADLRPSDDFLGLTLAAGHLKIYVQWLNDRTEVFHGLSRVGNRILHQIEYRSAEAQEARR